MSKRKTDNKSESRNDEEEADASVAKTSLNYVSDRKAKAAAAVAAAIKSKKSSTSSKISFWKLMGIFHLLIGLPLALVLYYYYNVTVNPSTSQTLGPIVNVSNGLLQGFIEQSRDGREFYQFLGIPYGQSERFEPSKPAGNWEGVREAKDFGSACLHIEFFTGKLFGQEDCLFLNVFTPVKINEDSKQRSSVPVMVFIHGGYFMSGSSNSYRADYFMDEDVVLVTLNYRLASLGFLNTGDEVVRGNMGLKDQNLALKWVQQNIASFGGDPTKVTIFGPSAGAAGVHYHTLSPLSAGLFRSAISQSGTAVKVWSFIENPRKQATRLGEQLNCPTRNTRVLVDCLKKLDASDIISVHREYLNVLLHPLAIFAPSVERVSDESTFLPDHPYSLLVQGKHNRVPWLTGLNSEEGLLFSSRIIKNQELQKKLNEDFNNTLPSLLGISEHPNKQQITTQVRQFYFQNNESPNFLENFENYTNMLSDRLYFTATHESILVQTRYSPVYIYYYTYPAQFSFSQILTLSGSFPPVLEFIVKLSFRWIQVNIFRQEQSNIGICHGDEVPMLFNLGVLTNVGPDSKDYEMSKKMVKLWTDFASLPSFNPEEYPAKTLEPLTFGEIKWYPVPSSPTHLSYLNLDSNPKIIKETFTKRVHFWKSLGLL